MIVFWVLGALSLIIGLMGVIDGPIPYPFPKLLPFLPNLHKAISPELVGLGIVILVFDTGRNFLDKRERKREETKRRDWDLKLEKERREWLADVIKNSPPKRVPEAESKLISTSYETRIQEVSLEDAGVQRIVGRVLYLPHRRRFQIDQDPVSKASFKRLVEQSAAWAKRARSQENLINFLEWYYNPRGYPLFERPDPNSPGCVFRYPITVLPSPPDQQDKPESILGLLDPTIVEETPNDESPFVIMDDWAWFQRMALRPDNYHDDGVKYIMKSIEKEPLRISGALGWYFDALRTCDGLEREILDFFGKNTPTQNDFEDVAQQLKLRSKVHEEISDPVISGDGRSVALAMSVLIVYRHNHTYHALIERRSSKTAVHADLYHVVPSFMLAPEYGSWQGEWNLSHQFQREFLEEVVNEKSVEVPPTEIELSYNWFYDHPELTKLSALMHQGRAHFRITGIAINLLNLRPEVCGLMVLDSREWLMGTSIKYNWEYLDSEEALRIGIERVRSVPIESDHLVLDEVDFIPEKVVPPGAAALWLGVDLARQILDI